MSQILKQINCNLGGMVSWKNNYIFIRNYNLKFLPNICINMDSRRTKRIDSICEETWIPRCARDGSVIKWGRGEGETLSIHVVWTQCALGLRLHTQLQLFTLKLIKLKFKLIKVNFKLIKLNFKLIKVNFKLIKVNFKLIKLNFKLIKVNFKLITLNFKLIKLNFKLIKLNFKLIKLNFKLIKLNFNLNKLNFELKKKYLKNILYSWVNVYMYTQRK